MVRIEELSREELIALLYESLEKNRQLEDQLRLKKTPMTSKNSSQPPSRDFKPEKKKRKRSEKKGAKVGHTCTVPQVQVRAIAKRKFGYATAGSRN